jgi:hypothetical protein
VTRAARQTIIDLSKQGHDLKVWCCSTTGAQGNTHTHTRHTYRLAHAVHTHTHTCIHTHTCKHTHTYTHTCKHTHATCVFACHGPLSLAWSPVAIWSCACSTCRSPVTAFFFCM